MIHPQHKVIQSQSYKSSLTLPVNGDSVGTTTIHVKFYPTVVKKYENINITHTSGELSETISVSGEGVESPVPKILITGTIEDFGQVEINTESVVKSYTVSGSNLKEAITITSPDGFSISKSLDESYKSSLTLPVNGDSVGTTTIHVKFYPTVVKKYVVKKYRGEIEHTTVGTDTQKVVVIGDGKYIEPLKIIQEPSNKTIMEGENATFILIADGSELLYQWYENNLKIIV